MELHDTIYIGLKASVTFRELLVEVTVLNWNCMINYISDWRCL